MDIRFDCRGVLARVAEIVKPLCVGYLVDCDHHLSQCLRFDHRNVLLPYREGNRFSSVKLDKKRADAGIIPCALQLPAGQVLQLLVNRAEKDLLDSRRILSTKTFAYYAAKVLLDQIIYIISGCIERIVSNTTSSMSRAQSGFSSVSVSSFKGFIDSPLRFYFTGMLCSRKISKLNAKTQSLISELLITETSS